MTIWTAAVTALLGLASTAALAHGTAVVGRHRAEASADLAALAAAVHAPDGESGACATAATIATRNGGTLRRCRLIGGDVEVEVVRPVDLGGLGVHVAVARARAGPVERDSGGPVT